MDPLQQLTSALAGRYEVEREIGSGGMATVYLARDTRHDRRVALKVLRPELGAVLGTDRFLSEIRVTANLQHPHLLPLFDSGEANGLLFYVMPYVEGETLRQRLERERQLPVDEAIRITTAVASALHYAHKHNVIHRDLKPENILLQEGQPVVSDFGIALAVTNAGGARITQTGLSLGTPQYMSPEQATGDRQIDARTDIYSLAVVLYEMLVGDPPHTGSTVQGVIAKVLTDRPPSVRATREAVPEHVEIALDVALSKLPADRWATAADFADALNGKLSARTGAIASRAPRAGVARRPRARLLAAIPWALVVILLVFVSWQRFGRATLPRTIARFELTFPPDRQIGITNAGTALALSPDGTRFAYVGADSRLYVRELIEPEARVLTGTEGARSPFFSPDGEWVAFWTGSQLKKVAIAGGSPITLASSEQAFGGSWGDAGFIIVGVRSSLFRISEEGGALEPLPLPKNESTTPRWPRILPGSKLVLFTAWGGDVSTAQVGIASIESGETRLLGQKGIDARYAGGFLIIPTSLSGTVLAAPFDAKSGRITGSAFPVLENVTIRPGGAVVLALDTLGNVVYTEGNTGTNVSYVTTKGLAEPLVQGKEGSAYLSPRFSRDGRRIAMTLRPTGAGAPLESQPSDIWIFDRASRALSRLTFEGRNAYPEWTPDGRRITFTSIRDTGNKDVNGIYWQLADGSGPAELLLAGLGLQPEGLITPDGQQLLFREMLSGPDRNIGIMSLQGTRERRMLLNTKFQESAPRLSPDGRWLAYTSDENVRTEVYVRPFPSMDGRWQVSSGGGGEPVWSRDGRSLYYWAGDTLMEARIVSGASFDIAERRKVVVISHLPNVSHAEYDVDPRGGGFVVTQPVNNSTRVLFVTHFIDYLKRRTAKRPRR